MKTNLDRRVALVAAALTLAACGRSRVDRTSSVETTAAEIVLSTPPSPDQPNCDCSPAGSATPVSPSPALGEAERSAEPVDPKPETEVPLYDRPPLYNSNGPRVSDVGYPYPIGPTPEAAPAPQPRRPAPLPDDTWSAFPETSFRRPTGPTSSAFPESSFGQDAGS